MLSMQPFPGLMPSKGDRVRVVVGTISLDSETSMERTEMAFVAGDPQVDDEKRWFVPVAGHGLMPAGLVKRI